MSGKYHQALKIGNIKIILWLSFSLEGVFPIKEQPFMQTKKYVASVLYFFTHNKL